MLSEKGLWSIVLFLSGCAHSQSPQLFAPPSPPSTPVSPSLSKDRSESKTLKLKLALDTPADLKVRQGDTVSKGQVLSDRPLVRYPLEQQYRELRYRLASLNSVSEQEGIATAQAKVYQAQRQVEQAKRAIAQFKASSAWTDYAQQRLNLESAKRLELENQLQQAQGEWALARAELLDARINGRSEGNLLARQKATLLSELQELETKFKELGIVRSPYRGILQRLKFTSAQDGKLLAEVTIKLK
ncbi:MAG: hypothetical protein KME35_00685 [Aphanocapsa sp. GSE-SYN-MK-11-07L]|jgi:multidrug efflux pump subunit AcrA (membrane-fusion protein)|nr:hypothetical protein [Aphanocapsa sp. GSE-SYN-MK-11-07L]